MISVVVLDDSDLEDLSRGELIKIKTGGEETIGLATNKFLEDELHIRKEKEKMLKVFIIGSMSCEKWIKFVARVFKKIGCEVDYAKKQPEKRFDTLVAEAFRSIADADLIVAIGKADGTFGEGTTYELAFAEFIGKVIIKFNLEEDE